MPSCPVGLLQPQTLDVAVCSGRAASNKQADRRKALKHIETCFQRFIAAHQPRACHTRPVCCLNWLFPLLPALCPHGKDSEYLSKLLPYVGAPHHSRLMSMHPLSEIRTSSPVFLCKAAGKSGKVSVSSPCLACTPFHEHENLLGLRCPCGAMSMSYMSHMGHVRRNGCQMEGVSMKEATGLQQVLQSCVYCPCWCEFRCLLLEKVPSQEISLERGLDGKTPVGIAVVDAHFPRCGSGGNSATCLAVSHASNAVYRYLQGAEQE